MKKSTVVLLVCSLLQPHYPRLWANQDASVSVEEQAQAEIQDRAQKVSKAQEHEQESQYKNLTRCNVLSDKTEAKYREAQRFNTTYQGQLLGQIGEEIERLHEENLISDQLEGQINPNAGSQFRQETQNHASGIAPRQQQLTERIDRLQASLSNYQGCEGGGRIEDRPAGCNRYDQIKREIRNLKYRRDTIGSELGPQEGNIIGSHDDIEQAHQNNERGAFAQSGCANWDSQSGECLGLTGPLFDQNERLKGMVNQSTAQAAEFARVQTEKLKDEELRNSYNSDYILFEMAVKDYNTDETTDGKYHDDVGKNSMISNIKALAETGAAAKNLYCEPIDVDGNRLTQLRRNPDAYPHYADSKSYHLFRAASATFLMAQINDTAYFSDTAACLSTETFNNDKDDTQVHILEKATNLSEHLFANLCLRVKPDDVALSSECDKYIDRMFGPNPEFRNMARTRENALEMFIAAHKAALSELTTKQKLVATAHSQVEKGRERVRLYRKWWAITLALKLAAKALQLSYKAKASVCCPSPHCGACGFFMAEAAKWGNLYIVFSGTNLYMSLQIIRWEVFVKKWKKKLAQARVHTHLACNQEEARGETAEIINFARRAREETAREIRRRQQNILNQVRSRASAPLSYRSKPGWRDLLHLFFPVSFAQAPTGPPTGTGQAQQTAQSLGLRYGAQGFHDFLTKRNRAWFLQAQDVSPFVNLKITTNPVDLSSLNSLRDYTGEPIKKEGFPIPETRVNTTQKMIELVTQNITDTKLSLKKAHMNMEGHKQLLKKTKRKLKLGKQGTGNLVQLPRRVPVVHCATNSNPTQSLEFNPNCSCQETNSCASFYYPTIGSATAEAASDGILVRDAANAVASGNLKAANVTGKRLKRKNALAAKKRKKDLKSPKKITKNQKPLLQKVSKNKNIRPNKRIGRKGSSLSQSTDKHATSSSSNSKNGKNRIENKKTTAKTSLHQNQVNRLSKKTNLSAVSSSDSAASSSTGSQTNNHFRTGQETASIWEQFNPTQDLLMEEDTSLDKNTYKNTASNVDGGNSDINRRSASLPSKRQSHSLNKGTSIFKIVTKRYKKSAYSLLNIFSKKGKR